VNVISRMMARDDEAKLELPRTLGGRYRPRWKDPPPGAHEDAKPTLAARDTILDRELELVRVPFGADRGKERDALLSALKARTTVLSPALVAVHDAGEWEDDAFVVNELIEAGRTIEDALATGELPSAAERLRWAKALVEAARVVDEAGLSIAPSDWAAASIDAYHLPRVGGLDRAGPATDATRATTLDALHDLFARIASSPPDDAEARAALGSLVAAARDDAEALTLAALRERLSPLVGPAEPERPLIANVDGESIRRRQTVLVAGLALFVLSFLVMVLVLARAHH